MTWASKEEPVPVGTSTDAVGLEIVMIPPVDCFGVGLDGFVPRLAWCRLRLVDLHDDSTGTGDVRRPLSQHTARGFDMQGLRLSRPDDLVEAQRPL